MKAVLDVTVPGSGYGQKRKRYGGFCIAGVCADPAGKKTGARGITEREACAAPEIPEDACETGQTTAETGKDAIAG